MKLKKFFVSGRHDALPFDRQKKQHFTWGFDVQAGGKRYQERGYLTKQHAEEVVEKIKSDAKNQRHGIRPAEDVPFLIELLQAKLNTMSNPADHARARRVFNVFLDALGPDARKAIRVTDLRSKDFETYIQRRTADGVSAATIRRELVPLIATLNTARRFSPALETYRPPIIDRPKLSRRRRDKTISDREYVLIMNHLAQPRRLGETASFAAIRVAAADLTQMLHLTASRVGEIAKLKKSDVDLFDNRVRIIRTKTEKHKDPTEWLSFTPTMAKILHRRFSIAQNEYLFTPNGKVTPGMRRALKEACEINGLVFGKSNFDGISFNRTRHTATSGLVKAGTDLKTVGVFTGHADQTMTMHYAHISSDDIQRAADILEANWGGDFVQNQQFPDSKCEKVTSFSN